MSLSTNASTTRRGFVAAGAACGLAALAAGTLCSRAFAAEKAEAPASEAPAGDAQESVDVDYRQVDVDELVEGGADIVSASAFGVYCLEGESPDSAIEVDAYYDLDKKAVVDLVIEEVLLPFSVGGASGWGILDEDVATKLGEAALTASDDNAYPAHFALGGISWEGELDADKAVTYTSDIDGATQEFVAYVSGEEGGAWYHACYQDGADVLDADGKVAAHVEVGTKSSIRHGLDFWMSPITFPGNIQLIKNYVYDNGCAYGYLPDSGDAVKNDDGYWVICDTVSGATLAGTPNYLNLIKTAVDKIEAGEYETVEKGEDAKIAEKSDDTDCVTKAQDEAESAK